MAPTAGDARNAVLVTGAYGNVGREVVRALLKGGVRVIAADHRPERGVREYVADHAAVWRETNRSA